MPPLVRHESHLAATQGALLEVDIPETLSDVVMIIRAQVAHVRFAWSISTVLAGVGETSIGVLVNELAHGGR